jgi:hypothetical protein
MVHRQLELHTAVIDTYSRLLIVLREQNKGITSCHNRIHCTCALTQRCCACTYGSSIDQATIGTLACNHSQHLG